MESTKKLYRSRTNRIISGVCGGIAEYFSIDPVIIRLAFILLAFVSGIGILLYIIGIIIIPEAPLSTESKKKEETKESTDKADKEPSAVKEEFHDKINAAAEEIREAVKNHPRQYRGEQIFGLILVFLGLVFFLNRFLPWFHLGNLWPFILIILGIAFITKEGRR